MRRSLFTFICVLAISGCHTLRPVVVDDLVPGQTVRARITGAFADSLSPILMRDVRDFEGVVVENTGSAILMEIPVQQTLTGLTFETLSQRVQIPAAAFVDLEVKEFNRGRTIGVVALAAVAAGAFVIAQFNKQSGGGSTGGPGGPEDAVLSRPMFSIPVGGLPWIGR